MYIQGAHASRRDCDGVTTYNPGTTRLFMEYFVFGNIEEDDLFLEDVSRLQEIGAGLYSTIWLSIQSVLNAPTLRIEEQRLKLMRFRLKVTRLLKIYTEEEEDVLEDYNVNAYYLNKAKDEVMEITRATIKAFEMKWKGVRRAPTMTRKLLEEMMTGDQRNLMHTYTQLVEKKNLLEKRKNDTHNLVCQYKSLLSKNREKLDDIRTAMLLQRGTATLDDMVSENISDVSDVVVEAVQRFNESLVEVQRRDREDEHVRNAQGAKPKLSGSEEYQMMTAAIWDTLIQEANLEKEEEEEEDARETVALPEIDVSIRKDELRQRRPMETGTKVLDEELRQRRRPVLEMA